MSFDAHKNFAASTVAAPPSPTTTGTSLTVRTGTGVKFPAAPFNATVWPASGPPTSENAEIVRVTNVSGDTLTIVRTQESTTARAISAGDQIVAGVTAKTLTDVEAGVVTTVSSLANNQVVIGDGVSGTGIRTIGAGATGTFLAGVTGNAPAFRIIQEADIQDLIANLDEIRNNINALDALNPSLTAAEKFANKNTANGYAGLDSGGLVPDNRLSANVALLNGTTAFTAAQTINRLGIATTSTDGLVLQNTTASTVSVTVQYSPRLLFRGTAWNSVAAASQTDTWAIENRPATVAGTTTHNLTFLSSINGAGFTNLGNIDVNGMMNMQSFSAANGNFYQWSGRSRILSPADGQINYTNQANSSGVGFDFATNGVLKVRTTAQSGYATVDALGYSVSGVAGASKGAGPVTSITVVNGIVTAIS